MNIEITSGTIRITDINGFMRELAVVAQHYGITLQALNADLITGSDHIRFAVEKAIRSFESGKNTANNLGMEIMLYASGFRQIERALKIGAKPGDNRLAIVLAGENELEAAVSDINKMLNTVDPSLLKYSKSKQSGIAEMFEITPLEIDAVGEHSIPALVRERVALLDIIK